VLMTPGHFDRMAAKPTIPVSACRALKARATRKNMLSESAAIRQSCSVAFKLRHPGTLEKRLVHLPC
jgi:hypothetical protein